MDKVSYSLLDFDELKERRNTELMRPGIYFLWSHDEIVYIGQSTNMHHRVGGHLSNTGSHNYPFRGIKLTACTFVDCKPNELPIMEALYIAKFKPRLNGGRRKNERPV